MSSMTRLAALSARSSLIIRGANFGRGMCASLQHGLISMGGLSNGVKPFKRRASKHRQRGPLSGGQNLGNVYAPFLCFRRGWHWQG